MAAAPPPSYTSDTGLALGEDTGTQLQRRRRLVGQLRATATCHVIGGTLLVIFGVVAIFFKAEWSYVATPIWSGIVIFWLTGWNGFYASNKGTRSPAGCYIAMSVIAIIMSGSLFTMYIIACLNEYYYFCYPAVEYSDDCGPWEARVTMDALIATTAFYEVIVSFVSASAGCCFACTCCRGCCDDCCGKSCNCCMPTPPPTTAVFVGNTGAISTAHTGFQQPGAIQMQGPAAPGQMFYVVQHAPDQAYPQTASQPQQYNIAVPQAQFTTTYTQQQAYPAAYNTPQQVALPQTSQAIAPSMSLSSPAETGYAAASMSTTAPPLAEKQQMQPHLTPVESN